MRGELVFQLRQGQMFNIEAGKQALRNINSLGLFSNIDIIPCPDDKNEGGIIASIQPGGTVSFEHRNIKGLNRSLNGSVNTSNLLNPQDDLAFKLEYVHPYFDGVYNPRNRTFCTSCFNSRKLSPVFTGGPGVDEVPPIWVDQTGVKANITENFTRQSKFTYGLVFEEITTRDEGSHISANGQRVLPNGGISADGPPTTLSGTGIDRMAFAQANVTQDNTEFVNGAIVGERNVFHVSLSLIKDLVLALAAELRILVRNTHVYAFAEHENDLGSSKDLNGNPTEVYRRMRHGSSYGVGVKLGLVRAEYAVDHNSGTGLVLPVWREILRYAGFDSY
ncbi:hypothetical protein ACH5RR_010108 [Cinchona calisaya]|uniref:Toc75-like POTRA domain-containing protein n=1 Tax=Cinchona calisaya TaxID=153742 RepID=A0ABD3AHR2_9GENT